MTKLITINGKSYKAADFDINLICDFEDAGISMSDIGKKMIGTIRMYVASCIGCDLKTAGLEISNHLRNGGTLDEIAQIMSDMMEDSDFFREEQQSKETSNQPRTRKKKSEEE